MGPIGIAFSVGTPHAFGPGTVAKIPLQVLAAWTARAPALERDIGHQGVVARPDGRVADHPVPDGQTGCVRSDGTHAADRPAAGDDRQVEQVAPRAAEDLAGIGEEGSRHHVDDHFARAEDRVGPRFDGQWRTEGLEDRSSHGGPPWLEKHQSGRLSDNSKSGTILGLQNTILADPSGSWSDLRRSEPWRLRRKASSAPSSDPAGKN